MKTGGRVAKGIPGTGARASLAHDPANTPVRNVKFRIGLLESIH